MPKKLAARQGILAPITDRRTPATRMPSSSSPSPLAVDRSLGHISSDEVPAG
ncbi:MAG TPA: hypothetical protein VFA94_08910 [Acidimicrobiales bacterium]|nr:hypothetical protein [Acidimicrobiales bacterium]